MDSGIEEVGIEVFMCVCFFVFYIFFIMSLCWFNNSINNDNGNYNNYVLLKEN